MQPTHADGTAPATASSREDEGLRCPRCDYNLTGLTENRCPECGTPFDPDALREAMEGAVRPIPGWDEPLESPAKKLLSVCWMTMFEPARFARRFPRRCNPDSVRDFWWCVRVAAIGPAAVVALIPILLTGIFAGILGCFIAAAFFLAGSLACEALLTLMLDAAARPKDRLPGFSWSDFVVMHGGFLFLNTNACLGLWLAGVLFAPRGSFGWIIGTTEAAIVCWWWYALARGVVVQSQRTWGLVWAILSIPISFLLITVAPISCIAALR